ncbi:MAG: hypothetical protein R3F34_16445 [Planctomycetota bacterium]
MQGTSTEGRGAYVWLVLALVLFVVGAERHLRALPVWEGPDEPGHYDYACRLADTGERPWIMGSTDGSSATVWDQTSMAHHPWLYYRVLGALAATVGDGLPTGSYAANPTDPTLNAVHGHDEVAPRSPEVCLFDRLRRFSILCGALSLVLVFATGRVLAPGSPAIAAGGAFGLAALPQWQHSHAVLDNGALATTLCFGAVALLAVLWRDAGRRFARAGTDASAATYGTVGWSAALGLGALCGLAILCKLTSLFLLPLSLLVALRVVAASERRGAALLRCLAAVAVVAAITGPFFAENVARYGDLTASAAHEKAYAASLVPPEFRDLYLFGLHPQSFLPSFARNLVGNFGWNAAAAPIATMWGFAALLAVGLLGWVVGRERRWALLPVLAPVVVLVFVQVALYNRTFHQPQGRYFFPGVGALALVLAGGCAALGSRLPRTVARGAGALLAAVLAFDALRIAFVVVPPVFAFEPTDDPFRSVLTSGVGEPSTPPLVLLEPADGAELVDAPIFRFEVPADAPKDALHTLELWRGDGLYLGGTFEKMDDRSFTGDATPFPPALWPGLAPGTYRWQIRRVPNRVERESGRDVESSEVRTFVKK